MERLTIKDIAKMAGVSHTTVSRALNGAQNIRPETYAKIMELSNTISLFGKPQPELSMMSAQAESMQPADMLNDIRQYAQGPAKEAIDQVLFALNTIQLIQMYQEDPETT